MKKIHIISIIFLLISAFFIVPKEFQNDTFYLIKVGQSLVVNGIDFIDHFSIHNLNYLYPHMFFSIIVYFIYNYFSYTGLYILTIFFTFLLSIIIYFVNIKNTRNNVFSLIIALFTMIFLSGFITLRSQILSYSIFILEYYFLNKLVSTNNRKYIVLLFILVIVLVNVHVAVYPLYIIIYFPYFIDSIISKYKFKKNIKLKYLIISFILSLIGGFISFLGINSYTYLYNTLINSTTYYILEHKPTVIVSDIKMIILLLLEIFLFIKVKLSISERLLLLGLSYMALSSVRHQSLFIIFIFTILNKYLGNYLYTKEFDNITKLEKNIVSIKGFVVTMLLILLIYFPFVKRNIDMKYINDKLYPVDAIMYIKNNLDYKNIRLFNDINIGSYLLLNDIPVFIDSRTDLYTLSYNKKRDIFNDYINVIYFNVYYDDVFKYYEIDYVLMPKYSNLSLFLEHDHKYTIEYSDKYFNLFKRN